MCQCCAPIGKKLAILFTLSRLAFIILGIVAITTESEQELKEDEEQNSIFGGFLFASVLNFFSLWSTFCCVKEEEKECCQSYDDSCCCACTCFSADFCILADDGENNCNIFALTIMLFLLFFRFYIWILVKCCGKRSRYCIQIYSIFVDLVYFYLILDRFANLSTFLIILEVLLFLSGTSTIIIMIYINYKYKKESEEIETLQNPLNKEKLDIGEIEMRKKNEIENENVYVATPSYQWNKIKNNLVLK